MSSSAFHNQQPGTEALVVPSQQELGDIADKAQMVLGIVTGEDDTTRGRVSATSEEGWEDARFGVLVVSDSPTYDPSAFLEIRYLETKYGDDPSETERVYSLSRELSDGLQETLSLKASDTVSLLEGSNLIGEGPKFLESLAGKPVDEEMLDAAKAGMNAELAEAFTLERQKLGLSLAPASSSDAKQLLALLSFAVSGNKHEQSWGQSLAEWRENQQLEERIFKDVATLAPRWRRLGRRIVSALRH